MGFFFQSKIKYSQTSIPKDCFIIKIYNNNKKQIIVNILTICIYINYIQYFK